MEVFTLKRIYYRQTAGIIRKAGMNMENKRSSQDKSKIVLLVLGPILLALSALFLTVCMTLFFGSCSLPITYAYTGEYKDLYTAAIYSIPDAVGYMDHGEGAYNSDIYIWEQDEYGRVLFAYC